VGKQKRCLATGDDRNICRLPRLSCTISPARRPVPAATSPASSTPTSRIAISIVETYRAARNVIYQLAPWMRVMDVLIRYLLGCAKVVSTRYSQH